MKCVLLGDVAKIVSGATPKTGVPEFWDGPIPWATPADLSKLDGAYISRTPRNLTESGVRSCATTVLPANSVLLSSRAPIGHVAINTVPMATNQGFKSLVPGPQLDSKYLYHWLRSKTAYLQSLGNGATFKEISKRTTEQIEIPLPPVNEQRRIAAILDHADTLRAKRRQIVANLDELVSSTFHKMFGSLPISHKLSECCVRITDGTHQSPQWADSGIPFLFITNITTGEINFDTKKFISTETWHELTRRSPITVGDVLYSSVGVTYGIPAVVRSPQRFAFQRHIAHIKPNADLLHSEFLAAMLASPRVKRQADRVARGAAQPTVNLSDIKNFEVTVPAYERQQDFVRRIGAIRINRESAKKAEDICTALFTSLQSRAFRGEL